MVRTSITCSLFSFLFGAGIAAAQAPASIQPGTVFKTSSELVVLDVVATDAHKNPVQHLTASDFTVLEDGKPQTIKVFEDHAARAAISVAPVPKLKPGMYTNFSPAPTNGVANVLLLDLLNTPIQAQSVVRSEVRSFLKTMHPGVQLALFTLGTKLSLVQGFTSDSSLLQVQLDSKKANLSPSPLLVDPMSGDRAGVPDELSGGGGDGSMPPEMANLAAYSKQSHANARALMVQLRVRLTLQAMNQLARYLSNIPGRKNLIWFSSSFPITILPDAAKAPIDPFQIESSAQELTKKTVDLMARGRIAVYPVSASALATFPWFDADNALPGSTTAAGQFTDKNAGDAATMYQMAEASGGKAFMNTNDFKGAVEEAIENGANYYTIAYTPTDHTSNGEYRKIEVKLDKPNVALEYRRGYYAGDAIKPPQQANPAPGTKPLAAPYSALRTAMLYGSPQPTQIVLVADVRPSAPGTEPSAAPGNQPAKGISGPFRRYTATFLTTPGELNCSASPDGMHHCEMEYLTFVFDADGNRVNMQTNTLGMNVPPDRFAWLQTQSFSYSQQISVPAKGEYFLRMGMRDATNDRVGAVELPVAEIAKLPVVTGVSSSPAATSSVK